MKIYASNFDIMAKPWATEADKYIGKNVWVAADLFRVMRGPNWVKILDKVYRDGNIYYSIHRISMNDEFSDVPGFTCAKAYIRSVPYLGLRLHHPIELATDEDLLSIYGLEDNVAQTEIMLDQYIGRDAWVKVSIGYVNNNGNPVHGICYVKILDKQENTYTYNRIFALDVDEPNSQYTDYSREQIAEILSVPYQNDVSAFGWLASNKEFTTAEIMSALDKPWLGDTEQ